MHIHIRSYLKISWIVFPKQQILLHTKLFNFSEKLDYKKIIYRSSWEARVMDWLDRDPNVIQWGSEETIIPYLSPVDNRWHRYFPDFVVRRRTKDNTTKTIMIEVKPKKQTLEPQKKKRITKQYINEVTTYAVNQAKWKAATEFCLDHGWEFTLMTEDDLGL